MRRARLGSMPGSSRGSAAGCRPPLPLRLCARRQVRQVRRLCTRTHTRSSEELKIYSYKRAKATTVPDQASMVSRQAGLALQPQWL